MNCITTAQHKAFNCLVWNESFWDDLHKRFVGLAAIVYFQFLLLHIERFIQRNWILKRVFVLDWSAIECIRYPFVLLQQRATNFWLNNRRNNETWTIKNKPPYQHIPLIVIDCHISKPVTRGSTNILYIDTIIRITHVIAFARTKFLSS